MNPDALSEWDRQRLVAAMQAFHEALGDDVTTRLQPSELSAGLLAAIRAVDELKPPEARSILSMPPAPERYDSLGRPAVSAQNELPPSQS